MPIVWESGRRQLFSFLLSCPRKRTNTKPAREAEWKFNFWIVLQLLPWVVQEHREQRVERLVVQCQHSVCNQHQIRLRRENFPELGPLSLFLLCRHTCCSIDAVGVLMIPEE